MTEKRADETLLRMMPAPEWTDTWHPIAHGTVLDVFENGLEQAGIGIQDKNFSLQAEGADMFGAYVLDRRSNGAQWIAGIQNSTAKHFALTFHAGLHVLICTNQAFSGDKVIYRRHTSGLTVESLEIHIEALMGKIESFGDWFMSLKDYELKGGMDLSKQIAYDAVIDGIIPGGKLKEWNNSMETEVKNYGMNLFALYNSFTRVLRGQSYFNIARKTTQLNNMIKTLVPIYPRTRVGRGIPFRSN